MTHYTAAEAAKEYIGRGWCPVPLRPREKRPVMARWQQWTCPPGGEYKHFSGPRGVCLRLGSVSGHLVDVDLDCPEARRLADHFLPPTGMEHGRASSRRSHRWYISYGKDTSARFSVGGKTLCELRAQPTMQTNVPPSIHPSGEQLTWEGGQEPAQVDRASLEIAVRRLALASALAAAEWSDHDAVMFARNAPNGVWAAVPEAIAAAARGWGLAPQPKATAPRPIMPPRESTASNLEERVQEWLDCIDSDDYHEWVMVGQCLHHAAHAEGLTNAYSMWSNWAAKSQKYNPVDARKTWDSFKVGGNDRGFRTLGSLCWRAKELGWTRKKTVWRKRAEEDTEPGGRVPIDPLPRAAAKIGKMVKDRIVGVAAYSAELVGLSPQARAVLARMASCGRPRFHRDTVAGYDPHCVISTTCGSKGCPCCNLRRLFDWRDRALEWAPDKPMVVLRVKAEETETTCETPKQLSLRVKRIRDELQGTEGRATRLIAPALETHSPEALLVLEPTEMRSADDLAYWARYKTDDVRTLQGRELFDELALFHGQIAHAWLDSLRRMDLERMEYLAVYFGATRRQTNLNPRGQKGLMPPLRNRDPRDKLTDDDLLEGREDDWASLPTTGWGVGIDGSDPFVQLPHEWPRTHDSAMRLIGQRFPDLQPYEWESALKTLRRQEKRLRAKPPDRAMVRPGA